ncbi:MAG: sensor histidine kinase [Lachnospiraceae bacterium]|nr:sensor histidine kinase [Lachnospiraceae bacterium]
MENTLIIILSVVYLATGFLGLLSKRMKKGFLLLLIGYLFFFYTFPWSIGQWGTFPLVLVSISIVYFGCRRNIWDVILSLTGYLIVTLVNHLLTVPLTLMGIPYEALAGKYVIPFLFACWLITLLIVLFARRYFTGSRMKYLRNCPKKLQLVFLTQLLLCISLMAINFVYGEAVDYPPQVLTYNGLIISMFSLFTLVLFHFLYQLLQENYELKLQQSEQKMMDDYTERMESFYEEFRVFRHDYKNILSTLEYYIESQDMEGLSEYFHRAILPVGTMLTSNNFVLGKLHSIEVPAVKSILYTKLITALNKGLSPTIELVDPLKNVPMDELKLSRILGILLDNAIEASMETQDKILSIAIVNTTRSIVFSITNSCPPIEVSLAKLYEKGYTTKEDHDGLGLYTVQSITDALENVYYSAKYDGQFRQTLEISFID